MIGIFDINSRLFSKSITEVNVTELAAVIDRLNHQQIILNASNKGEILGNWSSTGQAGSIVIVIQVHNRRNYLEKLIESLSRARRIERTLLVFSYDLYSDELNWLVRSISFAPVMQIFFPHSIQLHPTTFPGQSPNDCPRDIGREKAEKVNCSNYKYPDVSGHYREAPYCQTKHHWWWKANYIFNGHLRTLQDYQGPVLFIEEDHWLAEDFLHVLWLEQRLLSQYNKARILSLGSYGAGSHKKPISSQIDLVHWFSSSHNMAMAFNRTVWREIQKCSQMFCSYDDYNVNFSYYK